LAPGPQERRDVLHPGLRLPRDGSAIERAYYQYKHLREPFLAFPALAPGNHQPPLKTFFFADREEAGCELLVAALCCASLLGKGEARNTQRNGICCACCCARNKTAILAFSSAWLLPCCVFVALSVSKIWRNKIGSVVSLIFVSFAGRNCPFAFDRNEPFASQIFNEFLGFQLL
jgi:hypothetical protein